MATAVLERFDSRGTETGSGASVELTYNIKGTADDTEVLAAIEAEAAEAYGGLVRSRVAFEPVHVDEENPDDCVWSGTVEYTRPEKPEAAEDKLSKLADKLKGVGRAGVAAAGDATVRGTFNAAAIQGLLANNTQDRIAAASEETAKNTKKLVRKAQDGLAFA